MDTTRLLQNDGHERHIRATWIQTQDTPYFDMRFRSLHVEHGHGRVQKKIIVFSQMLSCRSVAVEPVFRQ
jgi:hypothetical protein